MQLDGNLAKLLEQALQGAQAAEAKPAGDNLNGQSAKEKLMEALKALDTKAAHEAPKSDEAAAFLDAYLKNSKDNPNGTISPKTMKLFFALKAKQEVKLDINLSDKPELETVFNKFVEGIGAIPDATKKVLSGALIQALKDSPDARADFVELIKHAMAAKKVVDLAKQRNLGDEQVAKLTRFLAKQTPFEGELGVLISSAIDGFLKFDKEAFVKLIEEYSEGLDKVLKPLVDSLIPSDKDLSEDPITFVSQISDGIQKFWETYPKEAKPVAQKFLDNALAYIEKNAKAFTQVLASGFGVFKSVQNRVAKQVNEAPVSPIEVLLAAANSI